MHSSWLPNALLVSALLSGAVLGQNETNVEDPNANNPDEDAGNNQDLDSNGDTENTDFDTDTPSVVPDDCHCGFLDPLNGRSYTDSLIVYFNETGELGDAFNVSSYEHAYEQGWGIYYREGALASNVYYENGSTWNISPGWLNLNVSAKTNKHLVNGAEIETKRQDMLYGSFRTLMRSAAPYAGGGSALTMRLIHNESISAELELLSMDDSGVNAKYATSTNGEAPLPANSVNYTTLLGSEYNQSPWDFWEYRMDWDSENIEWFAGVNKTRTMPASNWTLPVSLSLKHWSLGLPSWTEGPPGNDSGAAVGWMRLFFNSSVTAPEDRPSNCSVEHFCSTEDESLRLSTPFTAEMERLPADLMVKNKKPKETPSTAAIALAIASVVVTSLLIIFGLSQKAMSKKPAARPPLKSHQSDVELSQLKGYSRNSQLSSRERVVGRPAMGTHQSTISQNPLLGQYDSFAGSTATLGATPTPSGSTDGLQYSSPIRGERVGDADYISPAQNSNVYSSDLHLGAGARQDLQPTGAPMYPSDSRVPGVEVSGSATAMQSNAGLAGAVPGAQDTVKGPTVPASPANPAQVPQQRTRVDYLAGLVALCSILVAATHFVLTFAPSTVMEYLDQHYKSEYWARRTIEPFFFNNIWTGLFFTTSTRFLTTGYLRKADLKIIAEKTVCRTPRFMIPIVAVILFEYFMMDVGATTYLEYLPSITWSPWPSTSVYPNFGWFINETLQLIYLIPNAAPQLTWNYCTGVLWTIPVQLQNSWLVLLGVVIITEIKTPWKRFAYYAFCILNHWYALSWGSYFWCGLLLADLDITYKYRKTIQSHAYLLYPLITLASLTVFCSLGNDLLSVWTGYSFSTNERGLHPDPYTGLRILKTDSHGYPQYTEPKLNGLLGCVGAQFLVEISVWAQKFFSTKPFLLLFPHVFTIYLIHGLVWWSVGSLACVYFASIGLEYWVNILLVALISFSTLFAILPVITPVIDMLGKELTRNVWLSASEEPVAWKPTAWPLGKEKVEGSALGRGGGQSQGGGGVRMG
jgi:hypothetical protein